MTTDQPGPGSTTPPNVAALVDAIDARARQAGNEGASDVVQRMLGSVTDVLETIQDRLDHLQEVVAGGGGGSGGGVAEAVQAGLASFNARMGRLEEAFVQAVDESGSGTQAVVDEVRTVVTRALEESAPAARGAAGLDPETRDALSRVESALSGLASARDERPAQEVIGLALAAMGERLDGLEQRLVAAVQQHTPQDAGADLSTLDLGAQLAPLHDRLDAAEARVATAVEAASRVAVNDSLSPVFDRLDSVERRLLETPREVQTTVEAAFEVVQVRIASLEQMLRARAPERVDTSAAVRAAIAPITERLDEIDAAHRSTAARHNEGIGRVEAALVAMPGRLTSLEERVWAVVSSLTDGVRSPIDPTLLARLEEAVERLDRDESSARLVKLVEERLSAGLRAVTERTDEVRRAVEQLANTASATAASPSDDGALDDVVASLRALQTATHDVPDEVANSIGARLAPFSDRLTGLDERLDALQEFVARSSSSVAAGPDHTTELTRITTTLDTLADRVVELAARPMPATPAIPDHGEAIAAVGSSLETVRHQLAQLAAAPMAALSVAPDLGALIEQITGTVRREAELLTQRVAALAVGVEASRVLLEQHLQETENSIGRKAGEVTRRLAADFGIRTRRNGPGGRRDPRELGSG